MRQSFDVFFFNLRSWIWIMMIRSDEFLGSLGKLSMQIKRSYNLEEKIFTKILPYNSRVKRVRLVPLPPPATILSNPRIVYVFIIIIVIISNMILIIFLYHHLTLGFQKRKGSSWTWMWQRFVHSDYSSRYTCMIILHKSILRNLYLASNYSYRKWLSFNNWVIVNLDSKIHALSEM